MRNILFVQLEPKEDTNFFIGYSTKLSNGLAFSFDSAVKYGYIDSVLFMNSEDTIDYSIFIGKNWETFIHENDDRTMT